MSTKTPSELADEFVAQMEKQYHPIALANMPTTIMIEAFLAGHKAAQAEVSAHISAIPNVADKLQALQQENAELIEKLNSFAVWGSDACVNCETGRVTLFSKAGRSCIECQHKSKEQAE